MTSLPNRIQHLFSAAILTWLTACICLVLLSSETAHAQRYSGTPDARETRSYQINGRSPREVRHLLTELLGPEVHRAEILADEETSRLMVLAPPDIQTLVRQLTEQLNDDDNIVHDAEPEMELRSYRVDSNRMESLAAGLRRSLSPRSRISLDPGGSRIVVVASLPDHQLTEKLLGVSPITSRIPAGSTGSGPEKRSPDSGPANNSLFNRPGAGDPWQANATTGSPSRRVFNAESQSSNPRLSDSEMPSRRAARREWTDSRAVSLRTITILEAEAAIRRIPGNRLTHIEPHRFRYTSVSQQEVEIRCDTGSGTCHLSGDSDLVSQFETLLRQLDAAGERQGQRMRVIPLRNVDPETLERALILWKNAGLSVPETEQPPSDHRSQTRRNSIPVRAAGFQQIPGEPAVPIEPADESSVLSNDGKSPPQTRMPDLRRPSSDVTIEPLRDLDVLILRGRDPDVEELARIIQEIERLSEETAPDIDIVYLHHVQGEAVGRLITTVLSDLTGPLQGRVTITPLVKPNALLLIGWGEAVIAAKKLIARLDESVEPDAQLQIFSLRHAPAQQLALTVEQFLNGRGGLGPDVSVTADNRTNTLIVSAAPRDLAEIRTLVERLDTGNSESVSQARIFQLRNALAGDVSQTITQAITAIRGGTGTSRAAALELLTAGPDGSEIIASGLLDDVRLTPDPRTNRILVSGPAASVALVEQLIRKFDETPAASAQIKVFQVSNGDATDLVLVLRSLFPEQAATSTVPQIATAEGEGSLVPVRFSVDIRTNSIIATGTAGDLRIIEVLLMRLDESDSQERVNEVYRLKNSPALDVANAVNSFLRSERVVSLAAPGRRNPFSQIESEVVVVPEPVGNALIISATPRYFEQIMELVEGLDAQPPQVMIQVILAEVELDNLHEFGVELGLQDSLLFDRSLLGSILTPGYDFNNRPLGNANTPQSLNTRGKVAGQTLSHFSLGRTNADTEFGGLVLSASSENVSVLLRAMNHTRNLEILSRPQIMTLDNQPAFIQVGQRVPRIVGTSINQVGQVNSVELENVGLILGVTPRISPEGMVVMEIDAEKSDVGPEIEGIPVSISADGEVIRSPRVNITTAQTTVSSASGQTIVIGGLISSSNSSTSRRVPWLSDVPLLGNLFRYDTQSNSRKELLIILTPHVVRGPSEAEYIKQIEVARMSWISCDIFDWMNHEIPVTGQMDSESIPTIYPDETPGITAVQNSLRQSTAAVKRRGDQSTADTRTERKQEIVTAGFREAAASDGETQSTSASEELPTRVILPNWKIEQRSGFRQSDPELNSGFDETPVALPKTADPVPGRSAARSETAPSAKSKSFFWK